MQRHATPEAVATSRDRLKAIALMCLAVSFFACLNSTAKYLSTRSGVPVAQIVWVRFVGQLVLIILALGVVNMPALLVTRKPGWQLVRSVLLLGSTAFNFAALVYLRLDQTLTIQFLAPLVVALLAGPILGEWVGWRRLVAILVGFCGILVVIRPGAVPIHPAVLLAFGCMLSYALFMIVTRYLAPYDPTPTTLIYSLFAGSVLVAPFAFMSWQWPSDVLTWGLLGLLGCFGGAGHYLFILAYRRAPVSAVAPFLYAQLVAVTAIGYFVFGDVPDAYTLAGSAIIVLSGIYLVHREAAVRKERARGADEA